jgi:catechol 2,3-dioxygenase-like lactoylglutathione lyase family enzyme
MTVLGSILLATTDADRLRRWYCDAFGVSPNPDGFLELGSVAVLIDQRDDVADLAAEPARTILNFHVADARSTAEHLTRMGVNWLVDLEFRGDAWFGTLNDPDGNILQIIELTPAYYATRGKPTALGRSRVSGRLPAQDLARARTFYADKLGLHPVEERPSGLRYECGGGVFALFQSTGRPSGAHTQMSWEVDDLDATVAELRSRGVVFEDYSLPGLTTHEGIAEVEGNYPSAGGIGERAAWFHDSEGNLIGIGQPITAR